MPLAQIPLTRLDNADPNLLEELLAVIANVASKAAFTGGSEVDAFEDEFADYCGAAHSVGVSSGTEALALTLRALDVGPGDEVIVPANSFIATAEAVTLVGATPRLVDVDPSTHLLNAEIVEAGITARTRCVIPVHLYGRTVDLDPILDVAHAHGIAVVEDACQAHGAFYKERRVGSIGHAGCFSFYPAKNLGAWGDGGIVVSSDSNIADRVRLLRSHGENPRYRHRLCGTTARLDALQAAILRVKLRRLDEWNQRRRRLGALLASALEGTSVELPAPPAADGDHVFHQFVVGSAHRDRLREHLNRSGISTGIHYPVPIHLSEAYASLNMAPGDLPAVEGNVARICSLPIFPLLTKAEVERIAEAVHAFDPGES